MKSIRCLAVALLALILAGSWAAPAQADIFKACRIPDTVTPVVERFGGADRFAVSAKVSQETFAPNVPVAYLASGRTYADALAGSPVAGFEGGPVLLVNSGDEAPQVVQDELLRLKPGKIVVLGGEQAISGNLELMMERFAPTVRRISGADRFEVAASVAGTFMGGNTTAYVASGENFPDALSAAAVAGADSAPVLLVTKTQLPPATREALQKMPLLKKIVIVGGPAAVDSTVALELAAFGTLQRVDGADRFVVSAETSKQAFCTDNKATVFIASGENFPDALSGSVAAIRNEGPVLLVRRDAVPAAIAEELRRLKPQRIVVLGGEQAVAKSVEVELAGFLRK